jgi:hypothetical protein
MYRIDSNKISARLVQWIVRDPVGKWLCTCTSKEAAALIADALNRK